MKKLLLAAACMVLALTAVTLLQPAHHANAATPYASALSDAVVGTAVAQDCPCQTCVPEFSSYPGGCVSTSEATYCMVLINHSTGIRTCGWGELCDPY